MNNGSTENFSTVDLLRTDLSTGELGIDNAKLLQWVVDTNGKMTEYDKQLEEYKKQFDIYEESIRNQKIEIKNIKEDLEKQKNRIPEIVGLFSAIIALVLIDISVIKSAPTFLAAILLITSLTCSVAVFATLIHSFFASNDKIKFGKFFWIPVGLLIFFISLGVLAYFKGIDLYQIKNEVKSQNQDGGE